MHRTHTGSDSSVPAGHSGNISSPPYSSHYASTRGSASWRPPRTTPYARARGRGGRVNTTHRNRVLIMNAATDTTSSTDHNSNTERHVSQESGNKDSIDRSAGWVSKRDRHMQLINTSIYDKEKLLRKKAMNETLRHKAMREEQREKARITRHLQSINSHSTKSNAMSSSTRPATHEIMINGLRFQIMRGGSKLSRIFGKWCEDALSTMGLTFYRHFEFRAFYSKTS